MCRTCGAIGSEMASNGKRCRECDKEYFSEFRKRNREKLAKYQRDYRHKHHEKFRQYVMGRRKTKLSAMTPDELKAFRKAECDKKKRLDAILKNEVFMAYGGWVCACCGETERSFLTIDHMLNNGSKLRREGVHGHSTDFYRWLKKSGFPPDFQVLCMNCQFGKRMNKNVCPHQVRRNDYPEREYAQAGGSAENPVVFLC